MHACMSLESCRPFDGGRDEKENPGKSTLLEAASAATAITPPYALGGDNGVSSLDAKADGPPTATPKDMPHVRCEGRKFE